jgi:peptidoglycan hydrolase-like amidase
MQREYFGRLEVRFQAGRLIPIVEMNRETAVAAIVEAEGTAGIPFEARKAQAVVSRSYLVGARGKRHSEFDFCDEDHCQLLRHIPAERSDAARAAAETRGQVLTFHGDILAALYSANCGGHTRTLSDVGWQNVSWMNQGKYPFHSVSCPLQTGKARGHGVGMCQSGAIEIAKHGVRAAVILHHYFPDTVIEALSSIEESRTLQLAKRKPAPKTAAPVLLSKAPNRVVVVATAVATAGVSAGKGVRAIQ